MADCALPLHLRGKTHSDWLLFKWVSRGFNAKGPRCGAGNPGYLSWPPRILGGKGVVRWESNFAKSRIYIPDLAGVEANDSIYGKRFMGIEEDSGKELQVKLEWREQTWEEIERGDLIYSPSALQKFSNEGVLRLEQGYYSKWKILKQREFPTMNEGEDTVLFFRNGWRPDHLDLYWNKGPAIGLHWE